ncbi:hypothetical protein EVAR_13055_1 [Eumeta japonica]|uniref:Uncharacterized protein n=1 Tax=Eumeta variegata TaxID=151549 RepID=A0A4C1VJX6_EUMVA|nr:hypothetical protein EVAR_13055_1 [Eumeta japonica]
MVKLSVRHNYQFHGACPPTPPDRDKRPDVTHYKSETSKARQIYELLALDAASVNVWQALDVLDPPTFGLSLPVDCLSLLQLSPSHQPSRGGRRALTPPSRAATHRSLLLLAPSSKDNILTQQTPNSIGEALRFTSGSAAGSEGQPGGVSWSL